MADEANLRGKLLRMGPGVHRWFMGKLGPGEDAEDLAQEALYEALRSLGRFEACSLEVLTNLLQWGKHDQCKAM